MAVSDSAAGRHPVVVDVEPTLLADLLRERLARRGVAIADRASGAGPVVALVDAASTTDLHAQTTVRLKDSGHDLPGVAEVDHGGADGVRTVVIDTVADLVELIVALALGPAD